MSRPPRPYPEQPTRGELVARADRLSLVPHGFADFVELQRELADAELGLRPPGGEDEFTQTLFELSAAVAHVLARHQDHYGSEAFFGTAATPTSLLRHARRLAYEPDPGLSAAGVVAFELREGLAGELELGLGLRSSAIGDGKPQSFETLAARTVDAEWNAILPRDASVAISYASPTFELTLEGVDLGLEIGEPILLRDASTTKAGHARRVAAIVEDVDAGVTTLTVDQSISDPELTTAWTVYARPKSTLRLFGWDADPERFPAEELRTVSVSDSLGSAPDWAWTTIAYAESGTTGSDDDLFFARPLEDRIDGQPLIVVLDDLIYPALVEPGSQRDVSVRFTSKHSESFPNPPNPPVVYDTEYSIAAATNRVFLLDSAGDRLARDAAHLDPRARLLGEFELELALASSTSNTALTSPGEPLILDGRYALEPGMLVVFEDLAQINASLFEIDRVSDDGTNTTITCVSAGPGTAAFELGDLQVLANVVEVSHGEGRTEILGDSDGFTPHLRFTLSKPRVSQLASVDGAAPELRIEVAEVEWTRVVDFGDSGPDDRHYRVELDADQRLTVVFGDGRRGAVPAKGRRHIVAHYRVGLGTAGNLEVGQLRQLGQAHPLVDRVRNPMAITGGTEPADAAALRREGTRYIRTFDRAVSARDHADLALLYPGVARANASWDPALGIILVAATHEGEPIADGSGLCAFLQARRDTSLPLVLREPEAVPAKLSLTVEIDPAFNRQLVEEAVRAALYARAQGAPGLFAFAGRELGEATHLSRVYAALAEVEGLEYVRVTHFAYVDAPPETVRDVLVVDTHQWITLAPADLALTSTSAEVS